MIETHTSPSQPDIVASNIQVYEETAASYRAGRETYLPVMREEMQPFIQKLIEAGAIDVLDMGSGAGVHSQVCSEAGFLVVAVDAAPSMLQIVRDCVPAVDCINADFWSFQAPHKFDGFVLASFVHLFPKEDLPKAMERLKGWLNPGAIGWVATVTGEPHQGDWLAKEENHGQRKRWRVVYGEEELVERLTSCGFEVVCRIRAPDGIHEEKMWLDLIVRWTGDGA